MSVLNISQIMEILPHRQMCIRDRALGATKKQMEQLIFREGIFLTFFSIPVGLLFGFRIAKCGFNWLVEQGKDVYKRQLWNYNQYQLVQPYR